MIFLARLFRRAFRARWQDHCIPLQIRSGFKCPSIESVSVQTNKRGRLCMQTIRKRNGL